MTNGSSQGLFVIVAVVIFGIFVVISYFLFRDKLQTGLASIFTDSIDTSKGQVSPNPNLIPNSTFNDFSGWFIWGGTAIKNTHYKLENNELVLTKDSFTDIRSGVAFDSATQFNLDSNGVYSASVEIFIDEYVGKEGVDSSNSTFHFRVANTEKYEYIGQLEKRKWVRIEINGVASEGEVMSEQSILFAFGIDGDAKATIRIRKPKLELSKTATAYIP